MVFSLPVIGVCAGTLGLLTGGLLGACVEHIRMRGARPSWFASVYADSTVLRIEPPREGYEELTIRFPDGKIISQPVKPDTWALEFTRPDGFTGESKVMYRTKTLRRCVNASHDSGTEQDQGYNLVPCEEWDRVTQTKEE